MTISPDSVVLVVDDEPPIVNVVCDVLEDEGIPAQVCPVGQRAFNYILQFQPSLVVLDVRMPEVDGIQLFELMRGRPETASIPVLFFTANTHLLEEQVPDLHERGATVLAKPFRIDAFVAAVYKALDTEER
jgi:DNA-binding response OmpR family regulator